MQLESKKSSTSPLPKTLNFCKNKYSPLCIVWKPCVLYVREVFESAVDKTSQNQSLLKKVSIFIFSILKCMEALHPPPPITKLKPKNPHEKVVNILLHTSTECSRTVLKISYISNLNMTCQKKKSPPNHLYMSGVAIPSEHRNNSWTWQLVYSTQRMKF